MTENQVVNESMPTTPAESGENLVPQSKVDQIVKQRLFEGEQRGYERGKAEAEAKYAPQPQANAFNPPSATATVNGQPVDENYIRQVIANEQQKQIQAQQQQQARAELEKVVTHLGGEFQKAKESYPDFDQKLQQVDLSKVPEMLILMHQHAPNQAGDIMNELLENPHKFLNIDALSKQQPGLAIKEIQKLAGSIDQNKAAANAQSPKEPLSQLKPSAIGIDNGSQSFEDMHANPIYRW